MSPSWPRRSARVGEMPPADTVELLWFDVDASDLPLARYWEILDRDERGRAAQFRFERDRRRFVARRGALRALLGRRLGASPAALHYACNAYGKPTLPTAGLRFNLSHSDGVALIALADGREIGCDIERREPRRAGPDIAAAFFAASEQQALAALDPRCRIEGFFNCWTRKEAYLKARGWGLAVPLDSFAVTLAPGEPAMLIAGDRAGWAMAATEAIPDCHAAVVAAGAAAIHLSVGRYEPA